MLKLEWMISRPRVSSLALPLLLLASTACSSQTVKLVQPQSGATAECSASGFGFGAAWVDETLGGCARPYESRGYVRLDRLTPEQRADLERRGLLPK
jgi:hypothetical protein